MKKNRYTQEQIIAVLKQHHAGGRLRSRAVSTGSAMRHLYNWRSRYGGMEVSEARRLKSLEDENRKLK